MFLLSFERESMSGCFEYPQYHHLTYEKFFKTIWKKVWKFLKSKYASLLSQFYMAIVVFWMKFWLWMILKNFLCTFQECSTYLKGSPEARLFNARWIECLRCIENKLTLTKAQRMSNSVLSSHIWSLLAQSESERYSGFSFKWLNFF